MDAVIFGLVLVGLAAFVAAPLYRRTTTEQTTTAPDLGPHLDGLRQLEWDRRGGLVDEATYAGERAALEAEALRAMGAEDERTTGAD